jgi:hypothetical protein
VKNIFRKLLIISLLCTTGMATAQDVILKKDNTTVLSKVLEISSTEIKYKKWNNQDGPTYSIGLSDVLSITYENGEVENFSETSRSQENTYTNTNSATYRGVMTVAASGIRLKLDGRKLSHEEVRSLVGEEYYQLYRKGIMETNIGGSAMVITVATLCTGGILAGIKKNGEYPYLVPALVCGCVGLASGVVWLIYDDGPDLIKQVVNAYNSGQTGKVSFNISPSMMRCDLPQSKGNCGLGMTVSMNF